MTAIHNKVYVATGTSNEILMFNSGTDFFDVVQNEPYDKIEAIEYPSTTIWKTPKRVFDIAVSDDFVVFAYELDFDAYINKAEVHTVFSGLFHAGEVNNVFKRFFSTEELSDDEPQDSQEKGMFNKLFTVQVDDENSSPVFKRRSTLQPQKTFISYGHARMAGIDILNLKNELIAHLVVLYEGVSREVKLKISSDGKVFV